MPDRRTPDASASAHRGRRRRPRRGLRVATAAVSAGILLTSAVGYAAVERYTGKIDHVDAFAGIIDADRPAEGPSMNILLVGSDDREGLTRTQQNQLRVGSGDYGPPRTDTIMVMHLNQDDDGATVVSLPRDSLVDIPAWTDPVTGKAHKARQDKINTAFETGGAPLLVRTVESATGLRIDHYVEVNFSGFLTMVDALDGVPVCLSKPVKDKDSGLNLPAGKSVVTGRQALAYVRVRHIDSDFGRMARQQKFLSSMLQKATSAGTLLNPIKLNSFLDAGMESVTTDQGLGRDELFSLASRFKSVDQKSIKFQTIPISDDDYRAQIGNTFQSTVLWDQAAAKALFAGLDTGQQAQKPTVPVVPVSPGKVPVQVYNGAGVPGLGRKASEELAGLGFGIAGPAKNADESGLTVTEVRYDPGFDQSAKTVATAIPGSKLVVQKGLGRTIHVVVGSGYSGTQKVAVATTAAATSSPTRPRTAADDICG